jgi:hypothetical protein
LSEHRRDCDEAPPENDPPVKPFHDPPGDPTYEPSRPVIPPIPHPAGAPPSETPKTTE